MLEAIMEFAESSHSFHFFLAIIPRRCIRMVFALCLYEVSLHNLRGYVIAYGVRGSFIDDRVL